MARLKKPSNSVICIIRQSAQAKPWLPADGNRQHVPYWATLRYAHIYNSKTPRDDMFNSPEYTWALDTESVGSVNEAKELGRAYAKKLGLRIARYDERL